LTAICLGPALRPFSLQPTRSIGRAALLLLDFAPDEVCLPVCCQYRGGLLPRHFTITLPHNHAARQYAFCCAFCPGRINGQARVLPGIMPCGARTFLPEST